MKPLLSAAQLTDASLHEVLVQTLGARPTGGRRQVRAVAADAERVAELETPPGGPLLLLEGETVDQHGLPLEVFATWHRAEDIAFDVEVREEAETVTVRRTSDPGRPGAPTGRGTGEATDLDRAAEQARQLAELLAHLARG